MVVKIKTRYGCFLTVNMGVWPSDMAPELAEVLNSDRECGLVPAIPGQPDLDGNEARRAIARLGGEIIEVIRPVISTTRRVRFTKPPGGCPEDRPDRVKEFRILPRA